jgi:NitT/TauT family transport system permease protein
MSRSPLLAGLAVLLIFGLAVEGVVALRWVSPLIIPRPSDVIVAAVVMTSEGDLLPAFLATLAVTIVAGGLAIVLGVPIGYLLYRNGILGRAYESWLGAGFAAPLVLLYPLFLVIFGRSYTTLIAMGTIVGVIPIIINTHIGLMRAPRTFVDVGFTFNCSQSQQFWKILFPAAVPTIFSGIRLGLIYTLVNVIGIEFLINFGGLGRLVSDTYDRFDIPGMYASIAYIVLISALVFMGLDRMQARLRPL